MDSLSPDTLNSVLAVGGLDFLDPKKLVQDFGLLGVTLIIFAESCFAFFLPGDSLLFTAGFLIGTDAVDVNIALLATSVTVAAIAGNQLGYLTGRRLGTALFSREKSRFFKKEYLEKTHSYFEHYGPKTVVIARFIPIVRTFACIVAGAPRMDYRLFLIYNVVGAVLWGAGISLLGWFVADQLGELIDIDKFLLPVIIVILIVSFLPVLIEYLRARKHFKTPAAEVLETVKEEIQH